MLYFFTFMALRQAQDTRLVVVVDHERVPLQRDESNGAPGTIRTCDLRLRKPTLYPTELRVHVVSRSEVG